MPFLSMYIDIDWFKNLNEIIIECVVNILMEFLFGFRLMDFHADQHIRIFVFFLPFHRRVPLFWIFFCFV